MSKDSIKVSPKHGVNPSIVHCICCGKGYGVAMLGRLKGDAEAPRDIYQGLCNDCQSVIDKGGALIIEVRDGESGNNPYRTGRIVGVSKDFKERNHIENSIMYMEHSTYDKVFGSVEHNKERKNMYLKDGREIYESDDYPGYFIDANTGAFCDEEGNYVGGNIDNGDKPGNNNISNTEVVWITKTGKQFYPKRTKSATISISIREARSKGYKPSKGYITYKNK